MLRFQWTVLPLLALSLILGCSKNEDATDDSNTTSQKQGDNADHDDHDHGDEGSPKTFADAVAELAEHRDEMSAAYASGDVAVADEAMHGLFKIAPMIEEDKLEGMPTDQYELRDAKSAAGQIKEVCSLLHDAMGGHGKNASVNKEDYDKEADSLNDAIQNLQTIAGRLGETAEE